MKNHIHKPTEEAMEIIRRGGTCSRAELNYLLSNTPNELLQIDNRTHFQELLLIYLPEIRGYCGIYFPAHTENNFWNDDLRSKVATTMPTEVSGNKENKQNWIRKVCGYAPFVMKYYDITYTFEFETYEELEGYVAEYGQNPYFLNPRIDPAFKKILEQGELLSTDDCNICLKYRNYLCNGEEDGVWNGVIDLGDGERFLFPVDFCAKGNGLSEIYWTVCAMNGNIIIEIDEPPKTNWIEEFEEELKKDICL